MAKYFAPTVIKAQSTTIRRVDFYVAKVRFERLCNQLNERQTASCDGMVHAISADARGDVFIDAEIDLAFFGRPKGFLAR